MPNSLNATVEYAVRRMRRPDENVERLALVRETIANGSVFDFAIIAWIEPSRGTFPNEELNLIEFLRNGCQIALHPDLGGPRRG